MLLIEDVLKMKGIERDAIPVVSDYQHKRILGAARAISCILNDLDHHGVTWSSAGGQSNGDEQIHTYDWFLAYRTQPDNNPPPVGPEKED